MFTKLTTTFETPLYAVTSGLKTFTGTEVDGVLQGIDYKKIWSPDAAKLYSILPARYWEDFHLTVMTINCRIPPHTDTEIISTINFYITTDNCRTVFYKSKVDTPRTFQIENQTDGYIYNEEDLEAVDGFVAEPGDVWLLDVKQIHSVEPLGDITLRKAVTLGSFKHDYQAVRSMLEETGNI
jgi:hypothetical protein